MTSFVLDDVQGFLNTGLFMIALAHNTSMQNVLIGELGKFWAGTHIVHRTVRALRVTRVGVLD